MKKLVIYVFAALLLASCATLPDPEGNGSSLVIGNFIVDFPDGFFNLAPMALENQVQLTFTDLSNDKTVTVFTKNGGYYCFLASPGHTDYRFDTWSATVQRGVYTYSLGDRPVGLNFKVQPGKVIYLGHLKVTFVAPEKTRQVGTKESWSYDTNVDIKLRPDGAHDYITNVKEDSAWLSYDLVPARLYTAAKE